MKIVLLALPITALAACAESPAWHGLTSTEEKVAYFAQTCEAYGYRKGTSAMAQCVQNAMEGSKERASGIVAAYTLANPVRTGTSCTATAYGTTTTANCY